jgi:hypothetical protein
MKTDLLWWKYFLSKWNEIKFLKNVETRREFALWTNAFDNYDMRDYFVLLSKSSMLSADNMQEIILETLSRVTSKKTLLHNSRKILLNQSRNSSHAMKKILLNQSRNISRSTRKLSLNQSKNNSHSMRKLSLDQAMRKLLLDQTMRKLSLDQSMRKLSLKYSSNNSRSWRKSSLIFSNESFFQFEDILFESSDDADSLTTRENTLKSNSEKITFDHAFFVRFFSRMRLMHINLKEMQAMLWTLKTWIHIFVEKKVTLYCDN